MLERATHIRLDRAGAVERLIALGGRIVSSGEELHSLMLDADGAEIAPEVCEQMRWTLVRLSRVRILIVQQPPEQSEPP